jgi:hypothetical protein
MQFGNLLVGTLEAAQDFTHVAAVVTVLEQTDVELGTKCGEEFLESSWSFRECEHV